MWHQSSFHEISMNEKLIVNALITKVAFVLQFHAKLYRYSKRNVSALADIDAQSLCFRVQELKRPPIACSLELDHYRIFDTFNIW